MKKGKFEIQKIFNIIAYFIRHLDAEGYNRLPNNIKEDISDIVRVLAQYEGIVKK